jgi:hypothetical protein
MGLRKVAIIGKCSNSRSDAPMHLDGWEIWGLAWDLLPRCDRYFEMHENWRDHAGGGEVAEHHKAWMAGLTVPIYMRRAEPEIPFSIAYPMDDVAALIGRTCHGTPYLESSIAYMMALAMLEGAGHIGIWGCDLSTGGEYAYQRPNMEYLIGLARGRGVKVYVPPQNALLSPCRSMPYGMTDPHAGRAHARPAWMPERQTPDPHIKGESHVI